MATHSRAAHSAWDPRTVLEPLLPVLQRGAAIDLTAAPPDELAAHCPDLFRMLNGVAAGGVARRRDLLIRSGFAPVESVDFSPVPMVECGCVGAVGGAQRTLKGLALAADYYSLVVLTGLNLVVPQAGDGLIEHVRSSTRPGGAICVLACTVDDPHYDELVSRGRLIGRHTFGLGRGGAVVRFFTPGELSMAFEGWSVLHSCAAGRRGDVAAGGGGVATVVARRPVSAARAI